MENTDKINIYTDSNGQNFTKQRLFESIMYFNANNIFSGAPPGSWLNAVETMGKWYEANVHTYQGTSSGAESCKGKHFYECPLLTRSDRKVADDCSGFVKACLQYYGIKEIDHIWLTTANMQPGSEFDKVIQKAGFQYMPYSKEDRKPGDIMCGPASSHTEIFAGNIGGKAKSWSWGNIHDGIHSRNKHISGLPCGTAEKANSKEYKHIWRCQS